MLNFECDYMKGACPAVLRRLVETNMDETLGYGADPYCQSARSTPPSCMRYSATARA